MKDIRFFNELTGIRAIAAYMVFFHHFSIFSGEWKGGFINSFVNEFHIGVTFFFVLSGFLICYRYYENIKIRDHKWVVQYLQNRIARIYPMYFLLTTLTFLVILLRSSDWVWPGIMYFANITFLKGFFDDLKFSGIAQGWTLTVEECFYLSAPLIFVLSKKMKLIYPFLFILLIGLLLVVIFQEFNFFGFFKDFKFLFSYTFFGRCFEFFVGISLALIYKSKYQQHVTNKIYRTLFGFFWVVVCIAMLVLVKGDERYGVFTVYGILINNLVLPIGIAILFLGLITEQTIVKRILGSEIFVLLGKSSYVFYLIHMGVISNAIMIYSDNALVVFLIISILSFILYRFIEEPSNKLIRSIDLHSFLSRYKAKVQLTIKRAK